MTKQRMRIARLALAAATLSLASHPACAAPGSGDALQAGFESPPASARPRVWWHWMNGNITKDGIRKDIEWMHRAGVGGMHNFDAALATPQIVQKRLVYMTPEWKDAFRYAADLAHHYGMEFGIAASPGWSETGGPWVPPRDGMKKLVWSQTDVDGGRPFDGHLAQPPATTGPYQTLPMAPDISASMSTFTPKPPDYYADIAVLAFPAPEASTATPRISLADGQVVDAAPVLGDNPGHGFEAPLTGESTNILIDFPGPQLVRSASVYISGVASMFSGPAIGAHLEAQVDGDWRRLADVAIAATPTTVSFAPVTAEHFRLVVTRETVAIPTNMLSAPGAVINSSLITGAPPKSVHIDQLRLSAEPRVDQFEAKAGFSVALDYYALGSVDDGSAGAAPRGAVIDLTGRMRPDGTLDWTPPPGHWRILRLGYSLTGTTNHPATQEATGLEVDEYDGAAVRRYLDHYFTSYAAIGGPGFLGGEVNALVTDSTEVGPSNWTPDMVADFKRLRGYDPTPWLPTLTGAIIQDRAASDRFLFDFRRTLADLVSSQHYGELAEAAHKRGMTYYSEALESGRPSLGDDMAMRTPADEPMSALWTYPKGTQTQPTYLADMKGASSVAHLYGKPLAAAESLTTALHPWAYSPADLKPMIDLEFASGINRVVIHTSVHQPVDDKVPGLSLAIFGLYFNRHQTWAEMARPWTDYIARSSFMLQQGRNVADVAYFYGEEGPLTGLYDNHPPAEGAPHRYAYDFVNADTLLTQLSVEGGDVVSRGGARYRVLYLGGSSRRMTVPALKALERLASDGAVIVGEAPMQTPSQSDDPAEFQRLVKTLWSGGGETRVGRGRVVAGADVEAVLARLGDPPDFDAGADDTDAEVRFVHRRTASADIYYVDNRRDRPEHLAAQFRVAGRAPEIWRATTGAVEPASFTQDGRITTVPLDLEPMESVFVVFRHPSAARAGHAPTPRWTELGPVSGPWSVSFQPGRGAPAAIAMDKLQSLTLNNDPGVKYFSGVAAYHDSFQLAAAPHRGAHVYLDVGQVGDIAEVKVNGQSVGYAWTAPWRVDVTRTLRPGTNSLEIDVADLWVNRLIGDQQPGARKITFTTLPTYAADAPLRPSGLMGPVTLLSEH